MVERPIRRGYGVAAPGRHPTIVHPLSRGPRSPCRGAAAALGVATASGLAVAVAATVTAVVPGGRGAALVVRVLAGGGVVRSGTAWDGLAPDQLGPFRGWAHRGRRAAARRPGDARDPGARRRALRVVGARAGPASAGRRPGGRVNSLVAGERARSTPTGVPGSPGSTSSESSRSSGSATYAPAARWPRPRTASAPSSHAGRPCSQPTGPRWPAGRHRRRRDQPPEMVERFRRQRTGAPVRLCPGRTAARLGGHGTYLCAHLSPT